MAKLTETALALIIVGLVLVMLAVSQ